MPKRLQWVISSPVKTFKCETYFVVASPSPGLTLGVPCCLSRCRIEGLQIALPCSQVIEDTPYHSNPGASRL